MPNDDPIQLPIPIPDLAGADAGPSGLPDRGELTPKQRLIVSSSAAADLVLRTAIATLAGFTMMPSVAATFGGRVETRQRQENLRFYAELAAARDVTLSFPAPCALPQVFSQPANRVAQRMANGCVQNINFISSFQAVNPAMRDHWRGLTRNNVVQAQHWRHEDGPRPTLCVIHGLLGSAYLLNGLLFSLPWFYRSGFDVLLYTLPFHGRRAMKYSISGYGYMSGGVTGLSEATAQAVHDFRSLLDYLQSTGVDKIALTGISLGGFTAALIAAVEDRLEAVIPNAPVLPSGAPFSDWFPADKLVALDRHLSGVTYGDTAAAAAYYSPLNYSPLVPKDRRLIIAGLGDRLAPPEDAEKLWRHWDRCQMHWLPSNHLLHLSQPECLRRMTMFLDGVMFG